MVHVRQLVIEREAVLNLVFHLVDQLGVTRVIVLVGELESRFGCRRLVDGRLQVRQSSISGASPFAARRGSKR